MNVFLGSKNLEGEEVLLKCPVPTRRPESAESIWARIASESSAAPTLKRLPSDTSTVDTSGMDTAPRAAGVSRASSLGALACN